MLIVNLWYIDQFIKIRLTPRTGRPFLSKWCTRGQLANVKGAIVFRLYPLYEEYLIDNAILEKKILLARPVAIYISR